MFICSNHFYVSSSSQVLARICFAAFCILFLSRTAFAGAFVSDSLKYAWAGGLNSAQFCTVDINLDGRDDLLVFDRHGNRILPFINEGATGLMNYSFHPELAGLFPDLHDWVIFADYDCDGKQDIFTYSLGGIRVFRNVSDTALRFLLVTPLLKSFYYTGYTNILLTPVDYPGIADLDGDGDLDILTFSGLGSYVEYHKNLSMEKYGTCDSLDYRLTENCWGNFKESEGSNRIILGIVCPYKSPDIPGMICRDGNPKHTGSTFLVTDLNGDGLRDAVLGDIDFPNLVALYNGGTADSAVMTSQDTLFPGDDRPVWLFSFPSAQMIDPDNDGIEDLVVSPFDPNLVIAENTRSAWYYKNTGTHSIPHFHFVTDRFFQEEMIDVGTNSYPVIYDLDGDGLLDLIIGNWGYYDSSWYDQGILRSSYTSKISWYRNTGTATAPLFTLATDDLGNLFSFHLKGLYPAFGDLDGDGDADMLAGNSEGTLLFLLNTAGPGKPPVFSSPVFNYQNIDAGNFSAPQLFDLDGDGLTDLVIGEQKGNLNYYRNTGSLQQPQFTYVTDSLGKVNVTNYNISYDGYSTPCFFAGPDGSTQLLVGSEEGIVHYYRNIDGNLGGTFTPSDSLYRLFSDTPEEVRCGWRTVPAVAHLSDPGFLDLVVGNYSGGLNYFTNRAEPGVNPFIAEEKRNAVPFFKVYPNPAKDYFCIQSVSAITNEPFHITLVNLFGQTMIERGFKNGRIQKITTGDFPSGIYLLRITGTTPGSSGNIFSCVIVILR
jgi:hypothetical protein